MQKPFDVPLKLAAKTGRRKAVISLTPLIDVVFILLVFFMLASSFMDWQSLSLDTSAASEPSVSEEKPFIIEVRDQELSLNGDRITLPDLIEKARSRQPVTQPVSLQAMADTRVQRMVEVLDALNAAGVQPLNLVDDPQWQAGGNE